MSDSNLGNSSEEHEPMSRPDETPSNLEDATWEEVEKALSFPPMAEAGSEAESLPNDATSEPDRVSSTVRSFEPSSPLVMVETAFLASTAALIWLVNFYFPIGPVLRIFFSIPISLIYLRWGSRAAWMGALVSGLLLSVLMGPPRSLLYLMPFGLMGVVLGLLWQRKAGWPFSITIGTILGSFGFFFRIWLTSLLLGDDLWLYSTTQATALVDWACEKLGILFQPSVLLIQIVVIFMVVLNNLIYLFIVHLAAWFLFDRLGNPIPRPPKWVQVLMEYEED